MVGCFDRVLYKDGHHNLHDAIENFFIFEGITSKAYKKTGEISRDVNGKRTVVEVVEPEKIESSFYGRLRTAVKIAACVLTVGLLPAVLGLILLCDRSKHIYEIKNVTETSSPARVQQAFTGVTSGQVVSPSTVAPAAVHPTIQPFPQPKLEANFAASVQERFQKLKQEESPEIARTKSYEHVLAQPRSAELLACAQVFKEQFPEAEAKRKFRFLDGTELQLSSFFVEALKKDCKTFVELPIGGEEDEIQLGCKKDDFLSLLGYLYPEGMKRLEPSLTPTLTSLVSIINTLTYLNADQLERSIEDLKLQVRRFKWGSEDDLRAALALEKELKSRPNPFYKVILQNELANYFGMSLVAASPERRKELVQHYKTAGISSLSFTEIVKNSNPIDDAFLQLFGSLDSLRYLNLNGISGITPTGLEQLPLGIKELHVAGDWGMRRSLSGQNNWVKRLENLEVLDASFSDLSDKDFKDLPRNLKHLVLLDSYIKGEGFPELPPHLERLSMRACHIPPGQMAKLPSTLRESLKELDLYENKISEEDLRAIPPGILHLSFDCDRLTDDAMGLFPAQLATLEIRSPPTEERKYLSNNALKKLPESLRTLKLRGNFSFTEDWIQEIPRFLDTLELDTFGSHPISLINLPPHLVSLNLSNKKLKDEDLQALRPELKHLVLDSISGITDVGIASLPNALRSLKVRYADGIIAGPFPPALTHLTLDRCENLTDEALTDLSERLVSLSVNSLTKITDDTIKNLPDELMHLEIAGCTGLTEEGLADLPRSLAGLNISHWKHLTPNGLAKLPKELLFLNLDYCTQIQTIDLNALMASLKKVKAVGCANINKLSLRQLPPRFANILETSEFGL